jgi:hypothetical protein
MVRPAALILIAATLLAVTLLAPPAQGRDSLGVYATWGAFRDPLIPRCYAIAMADPSAAARSYQPFAAVGSWPRRGSRGQVHFRLSRKVAPNTAITLSIGGRRIVLAGGGGDAWPATDTDNAAIVAAMRVAPAMTVNARDMQGSNFANRYPLAGAASAMDAALLGCARAR